MALQHAQLHPGLGLLQSGAAGASPKEERDQLGQLQGREEMERRTGLERVPDLSAPVRRRPGQP
eukprot:8956108-Alexandrium_andersonii.AAC.1